MVITQEMEHASDVYIRGGLNPRVTMSTFIEINTLRAQGFGGRTVTIHSVPEDYPSVIEFTKVAEMPYAYRNR